MKLTKIEAGINVFVVESEITKFIKKVLKDKDLIREINEISLLMEEHGQRYFYESYSVKIKEIAGEKVEVKVINSFPFPAVEYFILKMSALLEKLITLILIKLYGFSKLNEAPTYGLKVKLIRHKTNNFEGNDHGDFVNSVRTLSNLIKHGSININEEQIGISGGNFSHFVKLFTDFKSEELFKHVDKN